MQKSTNLVPQESFRSMGNKKQSS